MCGRFKLEDNPYVRLLLEYVGVKGQPLYRADIPPGEQISIIREHDDGRRLDTATWWLMIDPKTQKPNYRYASFNSRWDKLHTPRSLAYKPYRESRCIIPASAICEGLGDKKTYHMIEPVDSAIAFGGLYKEYTNHQTGETIIGCSIITLPSCEKWAAIHPKSIPLMLDWQDKTLVDRWLDPTFQEVDYFQPLLEPEISHPQRVTPIDKPSKWNPIGGSFLISP